MKAKVEVYEGKGGSRGKAKVEVDEGDIRGRRKAKVELAVEGWAEVQMY